MCIRCEAARVALELLGTATNLSDHATAAQMEDREFLEELDSHVMCCEECGWWCETDEMSDDGMCKECA